VLRIAVVGSGPSGLYAAEALAKSGQAEVDIIERLPAPYGLVRYGVAPDHEKIKSIINTLERIFVTDGIRFLGNVEVGRDLTLDDLARHYDAVIHASGAAVDRRLDVPGEDLPGSFSATEFVAWYSGHPDAAVDRFTLDAHVAAVIGVGNVAVDVARILIKTADDLSVTDMPRHALDVLRRSAITDVHMIGRRGAAQAKFTTKELRELGEIAGADVIVDPADLVLDAGSEQALAESGALRRNFEVLQEWSTKAPEGRSRRLHIRFLQRPDAVLGTDRVTGLRLRRTALDGNGGVTDTETSEDLACELVLRSVGYKGVRIEGLPFDERRGVVPHQEGRVLDGDDMVAGCYVAGWIKRGPTGVIGTNRSDAKETVASLLADADSLPRAAEPDPDAVLRTLEARGAHVVTWEGWEAINAAELALGLSEGRERAKLHQRDALLDAARRAAAEVGATPTPS
jgi:ferredoxin--NADP+ reductase